MAVGTGLSYWKTWATKGKGDITMSRAKEGKSSTRNTGQACLKVVLQCKASGYLNKDTVSQNRHLEQQSGTETGTVRERWDD